MENLPTDIIEDILFRLPIEPTLIQCKQVCKAWRTVFGNKTVARMLFAYESERKIHLYYGDKNEVTPEAYYSNKTLTKFEHVKHNLHHNNYMVGSCNGLVCLCSGICNPVTGELICFSDRQTIFRGSQGIGFGYLPSTNEYKVVRLGFSPRKRQGHVEVYTLGSQSGWTRKEDIPYELSTPGIFVNGAIHWMCNVSEKSRPQEYKIVAFDLADENFKHVSTPTLYNPFPWSNGYAYLMLLGGNLCLIHPRHGDQFLDIWAFRKNTRVLHPPVVDGEYYDKNWSWTREFHIEIRLPEMLNRWPAPFAIIRRNEVLLWHEYKKLYCYDNSTSLFTKLRDGGRKDSSCLQAIPHINTLVSLKVLGECSSQIL